MPDPTTTVYLTGDAAGPDPYGVLYDTAAAATAADSGDHIVWQVPAVLLLAQACPVFDDDQDDDSGQLEPTGACGFCGTTSALCAGSQETGGPPCCAICGALGGFARMHAPDGEPAKACRHCRKAIVPDTADGWLHAADRVAGCGLPDAEARELYAVPADPQAAAEPARCEVNARRGTGTGACDRPLDEHGGCDRAAAHIGQAGAGSTATPPS